MNISIKKSNQFGNRFHIRLVRENGEEVGYIAIFHHAKSASNFDVIIVHDFSNPKYHKGRVVCNGLYTDYIEYTNQSKELYRSELPSFNKKHFKKVNDYYMYVLHKAVNFLDVYNSTVKTAKEQQNESLHKI